ncbi:MAG TPA: cupredoxin domain-containing protein [Acidimicrobiia bacterium]|nr:cupredoxin domain-containing protein [Acidimicrobiia bacterium]
MSTSVQAETAARPGRGLSWRRLVLFAGVAAAVATGLVSAVLGDLEGALVAVGFGVTALLTRVRKGTLGAAGMALVSGVTFSFMFSAALTNIGAGSDTQAILVSGSLAALSLLALMSAVGFLVRRDAPSGTGPARSLIVSVLVLFALVGWGAFAATAPPPPAGIHLVSKNVAFSETTLVAAAGEVTVTLENRDLFWHTFTIEELGVDLRVPVGAELPVTFVATPGDYRFICAIPGHPEAGMVGTLRVEG